MTQLAGSSLFVLALLLFQAPAIAAAEREEPGPPVAKTITVDEIVQRHVAAHGGERAPRDGQTFRFTVSRDWAAKPP